MPEKWVAKISSNSFSLAENKPRKTKEERDQKKKIDKARAEIHQRFDNTDFLQESLIGGQPRTSSSSRADKESRFGKQKLSNSGYSHSTHVTMRKHALEKSHSCDSLPTLTERNESEGSPSPSPVKHRKRLPIDACEVESENSDKLINLEKVQRRGV